NFYWVAASTPDGGQPWARMESLSLPAATGTPLANYRRSEHVEEQEAFRENLPNVGTDRLYYNNHTAREVTASINPLYGPDQTGTNVQLQVAITGFNTVSRALRFELLTGTTTTLLEDYSLASTGEVVRTYSLPPAAIDGPSTRVRMVTNPEGGFIFSYLNWMKISYDALFQATSNRLDFGVGTDAGARPVEVTGFADSDLGLYEITNPRAPKLVQLGAGNIVADGATWKLSVMPNQAIGEQRSFFAAGDAGGAGIEEFVTFRSVAVPDPVSPVETGGRNPDLIVITHEDFSDAIGRWVDHRIARSGGTLDVHVVKLQDVFDWYSGGLKDAWAIKRFTAHAISEWNSWSLMIVGDANENVLGKEVMASARDWSQDWVPTHYHVQHASGFAPELMASDKWYASLQAGGNYPNDSFPFDVNAPWDMYSGRFPCNSVGELNVMIDKVITVENVQDNQDWRRRGIFFADDEWSNGLGIQAQSELTYKYGEITFGASELDSLGFMWENRAAVPLEAVVVLLKSYMDVGFPYVLPPPPGSPDPRDLGDSRDYAADFATDPLIQALSGGGIVCHYQGHANPYVLSSEFWFEDRKVTLGRDDVDRLANSGKPWFFMGMGCHIADWAQNAVRTEVVPNEPSLAEKMLSRNNAGASAIYASSGFEFISANKEFGEYIFRRWVDTPPAAREVGNGSGSDLPIRSRWMTGELMWAAEADVRADKPWYPYPEMIAQYVILGDPLMLLDAGPAQVTATLVGDPDQEISGEVELVAIDASNTRTITMEARDEAGIDRIQIVDSNGADLTSQIVTETLPQGAVNQRIVNYSLEVPVQPYDHSLTVRVFDTGGILASDRHYELMLDMPQTAAFVTGGVVIDPDDWVFQAEEAVSFSARITSSAQLSETMVLSLTSETLFLSDIVFSFNKGRELDVDFTALATATNSDDTHAVVLAIDGLPTELVMQSGAGAAPVAGIGRVYNFPNPMAGNTRFVFESRAPGGAGVIRVFSVAGSSVAQIKFDQTSGGRSTVTWDGRDSRGDELGNGTYLYRVEIEAPGGRIVSEMQRLVMMR
ncbi:MAG: C25 family cysteine peptidase, partial [Candidatus Krumholzibacteria bacterium]|nr:C25 family cysteine peptidase [Candidatus Krumholzibacteria bacterium]